MKRPTGVSIIAILYTCLAMLSLLWSGLVVGVGGLGLLLFGGLFGAENMAAFDASSIWSGFLGFVTALVQIVVVFGLLSMKKWAWILTLVGVVLTVAEGVVGISGGGPVAFACGILGLLVPAGILVYLLLPRTRRAFGM